MTKESTIRRAFALTMLAMLTIAPSASRAAAQPGPTAETSAASEADGAASVERAVDLVERLATRYRDEMTGRSVRELVEQSKVAYDAGGYERAAALARLARQRIVERARDDRRPDIPIQAVYNEAVALQAIGVRDEARRLLERASAMETRSARDEAVAADASYNLGLLELREADAAAAEIDPASLDPVARILEPQPERGWSDYATTMEFLIAGYRRAAGHFERALERSPDDPDAARGLQIARLRAGELVRQRYEARREFDDLLARIVRPEELIRETQRLADEQGAAASNTERRERGLRGVGDRAFRDAGMKSAGEQEPISDDTSRMFQRAGLTRQVIDERVVPADPQLGPILSSLLEEFELGLRDAVESQRWSEFELERAEVAEGAALQRQAEEDLRRVLRELENAARNFQQQGQEAQQERSAEAQAERDAREEPQDSQRNYDEERRRDRSVDAILANEQEDLERVRETQRRRSGDDVEKDW